MVGSYGAWADADTSALKGLVADLSPEMVAVSRVTQVPDGEGGSSDTWTTIATVPGRVHQMRSSAREIERGGALQLVQRWAITLPAGTDVLPRDRLIVGAYTYEVVDEPNAVLSFEARTKVSCARIV
jgi:hypothetical protein